MATQRRQITDFETRREGNRWIGERPSGEELASWFHENVKLDPGMSLDDWVGGIVLISSSEKTLGLADGQVVDVIRLVHVPYVRVDARINYFWQLCEERGWHGGISPVGASVDGLPRGFGKLTLTLPDGKSSRFLTCTREVTIHARDALGHKAHALREPAQATKQLPTVSRYGYPDENLLMKAETGATGRALGMAGIFVLPGSGIATAEDMQEFLNSSGSAATPEPQLPEDNPGSQAEDIDARISELARQLDEERPAVFQEFEAWLTAKRISLADLRESQKRSTLRKLESYFEEA